MHSKYVPPVRHPRFARRKKVTRQSESEHWPGRPESHPRTISSNDYLNTSLHENKPSSLLDTERPLRPARDAGLQLSSREERRIAREKRTQRHVIIIGVLASVIVFVAGFVWMQQSERLAGTLAWFGSEMTSTPSTDTAALTPSYQDDQPGVTDATDMDALPTPIIATYNELSLHLPVELEELTEIAFHPANYSYAQKLSSHLPEADLAQAKKQKSTGRDIRTQSTDEGARLVGECLKLWRSGRHASVMTALDVGAPAGSPVLASIDGTVTAVKKYRYEDKTDDFEIHIASVIPGIELVTIHVAKVTVEVGDEVFAGLTQIGSVRNIAKFTRPQLASYTGDKGNHVHLQINDTQSAAYKARQKKLATEQD